MGLCGEDLAVPDNFRSETAPNQFFPGVGDGKRQPFLADLLVRHVSPAAQADAGRKMREAVRELLR